MKLNDGIKPFLEAVRTASPRKIELEVTLRASNTLQFVLRCVNEEVVQRLKLQIEENAPSVNGEVFASSDGKLRTTTNWNLRYTFQLGRVFTDLPAAEDGGTLRIQNTSELALYFRRWDFETPEFFQDDFLAALTPAIVLASNPKVRWLEVKHST